MPLTANAAGTPYNAATGNVTSKTVAVPTGAAAGDLMICFVVCSQDDTTITNYTISGTGDANTNWQGTFFPRATNQRAAKVFWKIRQSGDPTSYTVAKVGGSSTSMLVHMVAVPGADPTNPLIEGPTNQNTNGGTEPIVAPAMTVPSGLPDQAMMVTFHTCVVFISGGANGTNRWDTPSGMTELIDRGLDWDQGVTHYQLFNSGFGDTGTKGASLTSQTPQGSTISRGISLLIRPMASDQTIDLDAISDITVTLFTVDGAKYVDVPTLDVTTSIQAVDPIKDYDPMPAFDVALSIQPVDVIKSPKVLIDQFIGVSLFAVTVETLTEEVILEETLDIQLGVWDVTTEIIDNRVYADLELHELFLEQLPITDIERYVDLPGIDLSFTVEPLELEKHYELTQLSVFPEVGVADAFGTNRAGLIDMFVTVQPLPKAQRVVDLSTINVGFEYGVADWARGDTVQSAVDVTVELFPIFKGKGYHLPAPIDVLVQPLGFEVGFSVDDSAKKQLAKIKITKQPTRVIAQDILTGRFLNWDLEVSNLTLTKTLSGPQVISGEFPNEIRDLADAGLDAWATWIHVEEDGKIRGSGILQPRSVDQGEALSLEAVGVSAYAAGIPYLEEYIKVQIDPADVVREIWRHIQSYPNGNLGVVVRGTTPVRIGQEEVPAPAEGEDTRTDEEKARKPYALVWWEAPDSATEIANLAKETPFDYVEREEWNADKTDVLHYIDIGFPRFGRYRDDLRFAQEENLVTAIGPGEATDMYASQVVFIGSGEGRETIRGYAGKPMGGRVRRVVVLDDKSVNTSVRANALSADELLRRQALQDVTEVEIDARHLNARLGSFDCGDDIPVVAEVPWVGSVRQWERVLSYTYSPDAETIRVSLRRSESFTYGTGASTT